jgi:hypothetical protein
LAVELIRFVAASIAGLRLVRFPHRSKLNVCIHDCCIAPIAPFRSPGESSPAPDSGAALDGAESPSVRAAGLRARFCFDPVETPVLHPAPPESVNVLAFPLASEAVVPEFSLNFQYAFVLASAV